MFQGTRGGKLSNLAMAMLLRRMGHDDITVHGFRSTFRDWAGGETDFEHETVEMALAHSIRSKSERLSPGTGLAKARRSHDCLGGILWAAQAVGRLEDAGCA